jgi:hypothetical protein
LAKQDRVSVITSSKDHLPGHRKRLKFLERLKDHPVSRHIDFFGGYHNPVRDKFEALFGYKYHLALENSVLDNLWTEKIADPLLAWSLPIYHGCPNIHQYLPSGSFLTIDINDFDASVQAIEAAIARDAYTASLVQIGVAREAILNRYNIFNVLADICSAPARTTSLVTLHPARKMAPGLASRIVGKVRRFIKQRMEWAAADYDAFVIKLVKKIGEVKKAELHGNHVWGYSTLIVTIPDGEVQAWKTQQIVNHSKLGKPFNQWPTRRMKKVPDLKKKAA